MHVCITVSSPREPFVDMALHAEYPEFPPKADIRGQIYDVLPNTSSTDWAGVDASKVGLSVVSELSEVLQTRHQPSVAKLFTGNATGAHWKDTLALTAHLRTFNGSKTVAAALVELSHLRRITAVEFGAAQVVKANEELVRCLSRQSWRIHVSMTDLE